VFRGIDVKSNGSSEVILFVSNKTPESKELIKKMKQCLKSTDRFDVVESSLAETPLIRTSKGRFVSEEGINLYMRVFCKQ